MPDLETIIPVLIHVQAQLDGDLSLAALASRAGLSAFHFHRVFRDAVGETPKAYTQRLRLERAAFRLLLHDARILEVALDCGFENHETFSRAFRRHYGVSPADYRGEMRRRMSGLDNHSRHILDDPERRFSVSTPKPAVLRPMHLAFIRHTGPYEAVPDTLWAELSAWASQRGAAVPAVLLGIGHDSPAATAPENLRFDAAIRVAGPFAPEGRIGYQLLAGGSHATFTHAGHYSTLPQAYTALFPQLLVWKGYEVIGLPAIEIYRTTQVNASCDMNSTDVYLPVRRR